VVDTQFVISKLQFRVTLQGRAAHYSFIRLLGSGGSDWPKYVLEPHPASTQIVNAAVPTATTASRIVSVV
jgi:hypothetical protein